MTPSSAVLRLVADGRLTAEEAGPDPRRPARPAPTEAPTDPRPAEPAATSPGGGPGRAIRVEVTEGGRKVVNLRVPLALGRAAIDRIPGLSASMARPHPRGHRQRHDGPVLVVDDGPDDTVRISVE